MILDEVSAAVSSQLDQQAQLGIQTTTQADVPREGPANRGLWLHIPATTAVFADLNGSTKLNIKSGARTAAYAYTYFTRALTVVLERFDAKYIDVQGDAVLGLFSGKGSQFLAAASAITMRTLMEREIAVRFKRDAASNWTLTAGIGIDIGNLIVRQLGLRGIERNEVWAGTPVNVAAKLSSLANSNEICVSEHVHARYKKFSKLRQRILFRSCGCASSTQKTGLDAPANSTKRQWTSGQAPRNLELDFQNIHRLHTPWCEIHGPEFCEALISGKRP